MPPPYAAPADWQPPPPPTGPPQYSPYAAAGGWQPPPPPPYAGPGGPAYTATGWHPYGVPGYPGYSYAPPGSTNGFAIAALVVSIFGGWFVGVGSVLAVVFGVIALRQCRRTGERGRGLAIAGLVIGIIGIALWALFFGVAVVHGGSDGTPSNNGFSALLY